jgi:hypothetical protein
MSSSNHIRTLSPLHSKKGLGTKFDSDRSIDSHVIVWKPSGRTDTLFAEGIT